MIYEFPDEAAPIRQGDIFVNLPVLQLSLKGLIIAGGEESGDERRDWREILAEDPTAESPVNLVVSADRTPGIVITQDCDTQWGNSITLCRITPAGEVDQQLASSEPKKFVPAFSRMCRKNLKWFYLPPDPQVGFTQKMAVDFQSTLAVLRADLEDLRALRKGRLNCEADEHFRERLSEFFRRYPVDEWYPLNREEFEVYQKTKKAADAKPRAWQEPPPPPP